MTKNPPKAEIIQQPEGFYYKEQYREYSRKTKDISTFAWTIGFLSLLFSLIVALIKKTPVFIPIIAFIIASFVTTFVLMIAWLISLLF